MTLQTCITSAAIRIQGNAPSTVFSSQLQIAIDLRDLVQDVAVEIAEAAEWRSLTKIATLTGAPSFPLPDDYGRMLVGQGMMDQANWFWGYVAYQDVSQYLMAINGQVPAMDPGGWIILDGEFKFWPTPSGTATFPYISKYIVRDVGGVAKETFTADTDTFILPERLLTLGLIWRYRSQKGLEYAEDMATYTTALNQTSNDDKGARVLRPDWNRRLPGARFAYSGRVFP